MEKVQNPSNSEGEMYSDFPNFFISSSSVKFCVLFVEYF
jgi:hypothetical protein